MAAQNAEGVILRKYLLRETSYILVVFTKEFGKIKGVMKGVRNPYPQFAGNFEIFTRCRLHFYKKKKSGLDLITQCEAVDFFLPVRKDIEKLTYAGYFIELVDIVTNEHDPAEELFSLLVDSLTMLGTESSAKRVSRIFELKLLEKLGLAPRLDACAGCGAPPGKEIFFSVKDGGVMCPKCAGGNMTGRRISPGTVNFMRMIQKSDLARTSRIKVSREVGRETEDVLRMFLDYQIGRPLKSLKFLEQIEKTGVIGR
ncbi:MAG: DNA repair protein RecO [Candidatus Omnitrophota bacterium]